MRPRGCPGEAKIVHAVRSGENLEAYREHLAVCRQCREAASVASVLGDLARATRRSTTVPDASLIWWRSQVVLRLVEEEERVERRTRPLLLAQVGAGVAAVVIVLGAALTSEAMFGLVDGLAQQVPAAVGLMGVAAGVSLAVGAVCAWGVWGHNT